MGDTQMIPFNSDSGWSDGVSAFGGALIGSWLTNGGFLNGGYGRGVYGGINSPAGAAAETLVLDGLNNITSQLGNVNTTLLNSQASQNQTLCQGFSGINDAVRDTAANNAQVMCRGFSDIGNIINNTSAQTRFENMTNFNGLERSVANCCCETQKGLLQGFGNLALENCQNTGKIVNTITAEGSATRALINQNYINDLQSQLCDAKAKIGALEAQAFTAGAIANQSQMFDAKLANAVGNIITHCKTTTSTTTSAA